MWPFSAQLVALGSHKGANCCWRLQLAEWAEVQSIKSLLNHIVHPICVLMCNYQLAETISQQSSGYIQEPKTCQILCWFAQRCYGGRKHYFVKISFAGSSLRLSHRLLRSQGLQEGSPNNTASLPNSVGAWSRQYFWSGGKKVVQILNEKNSMQYHFYRNRRKLFLCICAPSTGSSAFTEGSQKKFCHWFQWEQKRGMRARLLIGIMLMDSQKQLS